MKKFVNYLTAGISFTLFTLSDVGIVWAMLNGPHWGLVATFATFSAILGVFVWNDYKNLFGNANQS